ncbi:MAG: glycoside hydrolase family 2 [Bacteroidales bacterium]|nr:glycoside hydrolase family 2 [Bacteroidales bacterium]
MKTKILFLSLLAPIILAFGTHVNGQSSFPIPRISPIPVMLDNRDVKPLCLDGTWKFNPVFEKGFENLKGVADWNDITVPGEWSMQGFNVDSAQAAGYFRTFTMPAEWKDQRIKLRFNGVYSESIIFVNGAVAGSHLGGFTAFELDITDLVHFNKANTLILSVTNESLADSLASGSRYACHPLGGISRSVSLFPLPEINISSLAINTKFDASFKDATLITRIEMTNESLKDAKDLSLQLELTPWDSNGKIVEQFSPIKTQMIPVGEAYELKISFPVKNPKKWDCENPNLYVLTCYLQKDGKNIEMVKQRFGFRQSEVKGNQLFINGQAVKLRGVNRHEVYPLTGRVVPKEMYRKDIELFREGNVNHIRTCHYPPDQALMEAADELGMFIECEGPFCWSHETKGDELAIQNAITSQNLEMIVLYRNHPSIIFWSMANESIWSDAYEFAGEAMKSLDPSRPLTFNYFPWDWVKNEQKDQMICAIGSDHYPSPAGPEKYANYHRPISFGEFVHLNAYNRYELATDVALRDTWGIYLHDMWEKMYNAQGVAGGSIWAGIDDTFYWDYPQADGSIEERTVGYGTWGPIDGWRRKKPEWWGMKKTYSPIRITNTSYNNEQIILDVENRQDFSNLNRLTIKWKLGDKYGIASADIAPREKGQLIIESKTANGTGGKLEVIFEDPRGFVIDSYSLDIYPETKTYKVPEQGTNTISFKEHGDHILVTSKQVEYEISKETGLISSDVFTGPYLMILPLNNGGDTQMHGPAKYYEPYSHTCTDWVLKSVETVFIQGKQIITVHGSYKEAIGTYTYDFTPSGGLKIAYDFKSTEDVSPRQWGIVFDLPKSYENLSWKRKGYWSTYPDWHIARLEGTAIASEGFEATPVGPRTKPEHEWRHDRTKIGSNDFASTKHNIYYTSLRNLSGTGIQINSDTKQHTRSWIEQESIRLLIANYSNGGSERFLRPHAKIDDKPLKKGDQISGIVRLHQKSNLILWP